MDKAKCPSFPFTFSNLFSIWSCTVAPNLPLLQLFPVSFDKALLCAYIHQKYIPRFHSAYPILLPLPISFSIAHYLPRVGFWPLVVVTLHVALVGAVLKYTVYGVYYLSVIVR